jgi:osmotically-inducible protein OsmY
LSKIFTCGIAHLWLFRNLIVKLIVRFMKDNAELQKNVQDAIKWEPLLNAAEIGVTVKNGVVTLTGTVENYAKKTQAEDAAKKVAGVTAVVEKIEVRFNNSWGKSDNEIATEVLNALKRTWQLPSERVMVKVEDGWVTLEGELYRDYQRVAAREAVEKLPGVRGVSNNTKIKLNSNDAVE